MKFIIDGEGEFFGYLEIFDKLVYVLNILFEGKMVGEFDVFKVMLSKINCVVNLNIFVFLYGEIGMGKEFVFYVFYSSSYCVEKFFVVIECIGLIDVLFEFELFGYEKGVFIGVVNKKKGLIEMVEGGMLFFDEVGDIFFVM